MHLTTLIWQELRHRWANSALTLLGALLAIGCLSSALVALHEHRLATAVLVAVKEDETRTRLAALARQSLQGVREAGQPVVALSPGRQTDIAGLQSFLFANVYRHPRVMRVVAGAEAIVRDLFGRYMAEPAEMPASWRTAAEASGSDREWAAVVADFVAGMTDRFAVREHQRLFDATPELR